MPTDYEAAGRQYDAAVRAELAALTGLSTADLTVSGGVLRMNADTLLRALRARLAPTTR